LVASATDDGGGDSQGGLRGERPRRADAQRSFDALLDAAKAVFATSGVDAPVREVADTAGVGVATLYRSFPRRSDLIAAVFRREIDACADAAIVLADMHPPFAALAQWIERFTAFIATKRGLASALHSGNPAFEALPVYFDKRLRPAFGKLLESAAIAGEIRSGLDADDILRAIAGLCASGKVDRPDHAHTMVGLFVDGLRQRADPPL
jgi:AcrR family transcriptional regulator